MISASRLKPHDSSFHQGEQPWPGCPEAAAEEGAVNAAAAFGDFGCHLVEVGCYCFASSASSRRWKSPARLRNPSRLIRGAPVWFEAPQRSRAAAVQSRVRLWCVAPHQYPGFPRLLALPRIQRGEFCSLPDLFRCNNIHGFSTFVPPLDPVPNTLQLCQSLASLPTSNSTDETEERVVIRHLRILHYRNSGNPENTTAPLSFPPSGDGCPSGALSRNGATSLRYIVKYL